MVIGVLVLVFGLSALLADQPGVGKWAVGGVCMVAGASLITSACVLNRRDAVRSAGTGRRDLRIRPSHERSASDDAFLTTVLGKARPPRRREEPPPERQARGPVTVLSSNKDTEFSLNESGMLVRDKWPRPGGAFRWKVRLQLHWEDIASLGFDYGSHDSVVSLWAVLSHGDQRQHIVDSRAFAGSQWQELALSFADLTSGRLAVDLTGRDHPGMLRDS
ncbi:hypothetical protein V1460_18255 [Streptomyces sp. SCSIO 30461]|uniref:hypothetical protein n=1 Tax=Streptomyces sp. SCSIO 30461 TaxID=3118085 RepID=UPI0030D4A3C7